MPFFPFFTYSTVSGPFLPGHPFLKANLSPPRFSPVRHKVFFPFFRFFFPFLPTPCLSFSLKPVPAVTEALDPSLSSLFCFVTRKLISTCDPFDLMSCSFSFQWCLLGCLFFFWVSCFLLQRKRGVTRFCPNLFKSPVSPFFSFES